MSTFALIKEDKKNIIFGIHPTLEALEAGTELERIFVQNGIKGANVLKIKQAASDAGIPIQDVPVQKLNKFTQSNHQGVVALTSLITYHNLTEIVQSTFEKGKDPFLLMLDRITDIRNIGAIARSANAFGVDAIIIPKKGTAAINAEAIKSSAGALNHIPVCREMYLDLSLRELIDMGIQVIACTEKATTSIKEVKVTGPKVVIMGSEENGISPKYIKLSDHQVQIPMTGDVASLNVSVAAGIVLYHLAN